MSDDYLKKYEEEYEKIYGSDQYDYSNNYNQLVGGANQAQTTNYASDAYTKPATTSSAGYNYNQPSTTTAYPNSAAQSYQQPKASSYQNNTYTGQQ